jgi:hypothetical protein
VLPYPEFGTREFRPEEEVFAPESVASMRGVPITIEHPDVGQDEGLVTTATMRALAHGWVQDCERRDQDLRVLICLSTDEAIAAYEAGVRAVSVGYRSRYTAAPGEHAGESYTGTQSEIRYNHLALLIESPARSPTARLDAAPTPRGPTMKLKIGTTHKTITAAQGDAIAKLAATFKSTTRTDSIETAEVVIDDTKLVLPAAQVEAIIALVTGAAPTDEPADPIEPTADADPADEPADEPEPTTDADPTEEEDKDTTRMDAKTAKKIAAATSTEVARQLGKATDAAVGKQFRAHQDAATHRAAIERLAAPMLGDGFDLVGTDVPGLCAAAITRHDAAQKDAAEQLAELARKGDLRAAGRLEERLVHAERAHQDSLGHAGELGLAIDRAFAAGDAHQDSAPVSAHEAARLKARNRVRGITAA